MAVFGAVPDQSGGVPVKSKTPQFRGFLMKTTNRLYLIAVKKDTYVIMGAFECGLLPYPETVRIKAKAFQVLDEVLQEVNEDLVARRNDVISRKSEVETDKENFAMGVDHVVHNVQDSVEHLAVAAFGRGCINREVMI